MGNNNEFEKKFELTDEKLEKIFGGAALSEIAPDISIDVNNNIDNGLDLLSKIIEQYTNETGKTFQEDPKSFNIWFNANYPNLKF